VFSHNSTLRKVEDLDVEIKKKAIDLHLINNCPMTDQCLLKDFKKRHKIF